MKAMRRSPEKYFGKKELTEQNVIDYITKGYAPSAKSFSALMNICEPLFDSHMNDEEAEESYEIGDFNLGNDLKSAMHFAAVLCLNMFDENNLTQLYNLKVALDKKQTVKTVIVIGVVAIIIVGGVATYKIIKSKDGKVIDDIPDIDEDIPTYIPDDLDDDVIQDLPSFDEKEDI